MAGLYQRRQVCVRSRGHLPVRKAQFPIRCQKMRSVISPTALEETVGSRQKLERVHAQFAQIRAPGAQYLESFKVGAARRFVDQSQRVLEGPHAAFTRARTL